VLGRRLAYYLRSIVPLLTRMDSPLTVLKAFLRWPLAAPFPIRLRGLGLTFKVRGAMDLWVLKEVCLDREYERFGFVPQDGWQMVDIGAGLGDWAVSVAARCPQARIRAYEPFPESYALLVENVRLNRLENVRTFPAGVGSCAGTALLEAAGREAVMVKARVRGGEGAGGVPVIALSEALGSAPCDLLKMDCEGCEYELVLHSDPALWSAVRRACLEYHEGVGGHSHGEVVAALRERGFQVEAFPRQTHADTGFIRAWKQ